MKRIICMSFDGDYKTERPVFKTNEEAWEYSNDLGSKWYFYPFHFVTTESGKTISDAPPMLEWAIGKRTSKVADVFRRTSKLPELRNADCDEFMFALLAA